MASRSRAAQQALSELEKSSAQFEEQLLEAAKFIGADIDTISGSSIEVLKEGDTSVNHGKEEWLLKWLLKRLQSPKDDVPRSMPLSWNLLLHLLRKLPLSIAARILGERKYMTILQKSLEEAKLRPVEEQPHLGLGSLDEIDEPKKSKKRKRTGELAGTSRARSYGIQPLLAGILAVTDFIVGSTKLSARQSYDGRDAEFSAEYMRTILRLSAEDSAKLLGSWLSLMQKHDILLHYGQLPWLSSLTEMWHLHTADDNYLVHFSLHCTVPLLSLLRNLPASSSFEPQIEKLLARNIIIPSKAAREENSESTVLGDLTKLAVISESSNASRLFEIAIRSIKPQSSRRRRPNDETWLQAVFNSLGESMPQKMAAKNWKAICSMIQSAISHKVDLELSVLRSVTATYALLEGGETYWELLHLIIKLDANVFLIPNTEQDLLQDLLVRVNKVSVDPDFVPVRKMVIEDVVVPLMKAFATARDLTGFIHHWFAQLVEVEKSRKALGSSPAEEFGVWEDSRLQEGLKNLLEASLATNQILQALDWLEEKTTENPGPVSVILQAVSGSISGEELVDAVALRCYHIMFDNRTFDTLDDRYKWRVWRILSNALALANPAGIEEISTLWTDLAIPFNSFSGKVKLSSQIDIKVSKSQLCALELWKFACVVWTVAKDGSTLQSLAKPLVLGLLHSFNTEVKDFVQTSRKDGGSLERQNILRYTRCLFIDYPTVLVLAAETEGQAAREMLRNVFWIASASDDGANPQPETAISDPATMGFEDIWISALQDDRILNKTAIAEMMIDTMLENETHSSNPLITPTTNNSLAIKSLLRVPITALHRKHRERIMKAWPPLLSEPVSARGTSYAPASTDAAVLALKIKTMRFPLFYEGMDFQQLADMAVALTDQSVSSPKYNVALFKEYSKLSLDFILTNIDQTRNQKYIEDAFTFVQKSAKKSHKHSTHESSFASIALFEVILMTIRGNLEKLIKAGIIKEKDLTKFETLLRESLYIQLQASLDILLGKKTPDPQNHLVLFSILDALTLLRLDQSKVKEIREKSQKIFGGKIKVSADLKTRMNIFLVSQITDDLEYEAALRVADSSSVGGRLSIREQVQAAMSTDKNGKTRLLKSLLPHSTSVTLEIGQLLALREIILRCDNGRRNKQSKDSDSDSDSDSSEAEEDIDLSEVYSILCAQLHRANGVRQFCIISEILEVMLRTKARSMSQWNIDNTLGSISIICSRNGPALRASRGTTIYIHLCHLLQAILVSHRLKLEGHFHLVVQALQPLLRCLFTPIPHSNTKTLRLYAPPPWLQSTHPLTSMHASAFTRLITLICDPSVLSVTRSAQNNLTSATDKAKRMAGQHMQFVLMSYVRLQLEMKMQPQVREKMVPGLYAIFDTTTVELRKTISEGLDSSGRAVFGSLYRDYLRFGKWKGS